jgi:hypothetical protein
VSGTEKNIALLKDKFEPASYQQSPAKHAEALKRMAIA